MHIEMGVDGVEWPNDVVDFLFRHLRMHDFV